MAVREREISDLGLESTVHLDYGAEADTAEGGQDERVCRGNCWRKIETDIAREEDRILGDGSNAGADNFARKLGDVEVVNEDSARCDVEKA